MRNPLKILIADRNRHVRDLLRREFAVEGYRVQVAKDGREVLAFLNGTHPPNLLILDPEVPFLGESEVLERLQERHPPLPVIIHSFEPDHLGGALGDFAFEEKKGNTDLLKAIVAVILCPFHRKCFGIKPAYPG